MRRRIVLIVFTLAGCSPSESEQARRELTLIEQSHGTADEICEAKRKLAQAYLHENNKQEYPLANVEAGLACNEAFMRRSGM
jgi:hypothetical protein